MPNIGASPNHSLSTLTARINAQAEAERQALENQVETEFKTLCANLRASATNAFSTIESDIQAAVETTREKTTAQIKLLNSGFMERWLLCGLASVALFLIVTLAGMGMGFLAKHYLTSLRQDLDELSNQKAALEATVQQLHSQTWGLTLIEDDNGKFIVPPPRAKLKAGWRYGDRPAIKME